MGNALEFILRLQDQLSPAVKQAAAITDSAAMRIQNDMGKVAMKTKEAGTEMESLKEKSKGFNLGHMLEGIGISAGLFKLNEMMSEGIEKAHQFHEAEAALANTMKNMGSFSQEAYEKVIAGAGAMAANIKFSRTEVIDLQSQLRLVGGIGEKEMQRMSLASADMATKFHMSLSEAGSSIAKAVNNPEMLRRLGMQLKIDPAIQVHLQNLAKHGHEAQARLELLNIVESKVGGAAKAAFDADPMARYNKAIGSIQITMGDAAINIQKTLAPAMEWLAIKFKDVVTFVASFTETIVANKPALFMLAGGIGLITIATAGWSAAQGVLNFIMGLNPIVRWISLILIVGGVIYTVIKQFDGWGKSMQGLWVVIKGFGLLALNAFKTMGEGIAYHLELAWYKAKSFFERIGGAITNVATALKLAMQGDFEGAQKALTANITVSATKDIANLEAQHKLAQRTSQAEGHSILTYMAAGLKMVDLKRAAGGTTEQSPALASDGTGETGTNSNDGNLGLDTKSKADGINSGGQRSIVINISKMIEKMEVHVMSAKEGAVEIEEAVKQAMRKVMYNITEAQPQ